MSVSHAIVHARLRNRAFSVSAAVMSETSLLHVFNAFNMYNKELLENSSVFSFVGLM